ncbi:MAG: hypothetical protein RL662_1618, partial [Bacteroidota bacterium]
MKRFPLYLSFILASVFLFSACVDGINEDPNRPSEVPTKALITAAQKQLVGNLRSQGASLDGSMLFVQYYSKNTYTDGSRYSLQGFKDNGYWGNLYQTLNNLEEVIKLNTNAATKDKVVLENMGRNATQIAVSRILKAYAFYALTDVLGDVPYQSYGKTDTDFEALQQAPQNLIPRYAPQEKIYVDILNELQAAGDTLIKYKTESTFPIGDIIYAGNNEKWAKFANSFRLRIAMHLKAKNNVVYVQHFEDALAKGVFVSNADNAVFNYSNTAPNEAPLYRATVTQNRKDYAVSHIFVNLLQGTLGTVNAVDPRLPIFALPNKQGLYVGLPYGLDKDVAGNFKVDDVSLPGSVVNAANFGEVLMEYSEVLFLISEHKGWSEGEYRAGVEASLDKWGVSSADKLGYLDKLPAVSKENVLNQKYIALFTQGLEAWSEYRRT